MSQCGGSYPDGPVGLQICAVNLQDSEEQKHISESEMNDLERVMELGVCGDVPEPPASACVPVKC